MYSDKHFVNSKPDNQSVITLRTFTKLPYSQTCLKQAPINGQTKIACSKQVIAEHSLICIEMVALVNAFFPL